MKKGVVFVLILTLLLVSPSIYAEEQNQASLTQTQLQSYSGFSRFVDNVRMFFTFDKDGKVKLSLEIREKEVKSAIVNAKAGDVQEVEKGLENALNHLLVVQEKVSSEGANDVSASVDRVMNLIEENNLSNQLNRYVLEEQKTQLVAELVIEFEGKERQALKREVVKNGTDGRNFVRVEIAEENGQVRVMEIEGELAQIQNQIAEHTYAGGKGQVVVTGEGKDNNGGESNVVVEGKDNGIKTYAEGDGTTRNDPLPVPDLTRINPALYNPNARAPGDTIDETYDDAEVNKGSCGDGVVCEGENNVVEGGEGIEGTNEIAPAVESN